MFVFTRISFARQFLLASFVILFSGMLLIGTWLGRQIELGVIHRTAAVTALYVDSLISHHLQYLIEPDTSFDSHEAEVDTVLTTTPLGQRIVAYKVWAHDGSILYSTNPTLIGQQFPMEGGLEKAFAGDVYTEISDLNKEENIYEQQKWSQLIETYAPLRVGDENKVVAVIEFYQAMDELKGEIQAAQQRSWVVVSVSTVVMYLLLAGLVGRASNTILAQQNELQDKVFQLTTLLAKNEELHTRVSRAATRAAALNERFLRRIAADLHDGPGQDLSLALLRIDELAEVCATCKVSTVKKHGANDDFSMIQTALKSALNDMREILAGLRLPEINQLSAVGTAERAIHDYQRKTGETVILQVGGKLDDAPLSVKITMYRILQESLANSFRHAVGADKRVRIDRQGNQLIAEVSDNGGGFDQKAILSEDHLGLVGMRERVEILGGTFEVESAAGKGTIIRTHLPLNEAERDNE
ncbi:MAG: sensor histidine kinase [Chloroflexi bacterium]|nr:sensor histidine kinase [Chloroflexota bacterium]